MPAPDPFKDLLFASHPDRIAKALVRLLSEDAEFSAHVCGRIQRVRPVARSIFEQPDVPLPSLYIVPGIFEPDDAVGCVRERWAFDLVYAYEDGRTEIGDGGTVSRVVAKVHAMLLSNPCLQFSDAYSGRPLASQFLGLNNVGAAEFTDNDDRLTQAQVLTARYEFSVNPDTGQPDGFLETEF